MSFSQLTHIATLTALEAGDLLSRGFGTSFQITAKEGRQNLVTEYDHASQELIIKKIKSFFPDHGFLAEEEGEEKAHPTDQVLWAIDPLDGTVNFAHNVPIFATSIAATKGKEILSGVIYNPMSGELFIAEKGSGAYLNGKKLTVSKTDTFERALIATGFPYDALENPLHCIDRFPKMIKLGLSIRQCGVASIDLAYVAAGRFDVLWEVGLHPWDVAAGKLLIEEAGGKVSHYDGSEHQIFAYLPMLASNGYLHAKMVELLKEDLK